MMSTSADGNPLRKSGTKSMFEAFMESTQAGLGLVSESELVKTIPFLGSALKVLQGLEDFRSRIFAKKMLAFMVDPSLQTPEAKAAIQDKINESPEAAEEVGETLFLILDKVVDLRKPHLLAKVFLAYSNGTINLVQLRRLAGAIDIAFVDDIERLRQGTASDEVLEQLLPSGLAAIDYTAVYGGFDSLTYKASSLGRSLSQILHVPKEAKA